MKKVNYPYYWEDNVFWINNSNKTNNTFTIPKHLKIKTIYNYKRIPRKLKKFFRNITTDIEHLCFYSYNKKDELNIFMWEILEYIHPNYKQFLINQICL